MPFDLQIINAKEFIRMGARGRLDLKASKALLAEMARACWKRQINQALLDLRTLQIGPKPVFSPRELAALVNTFHEIGFRQDQRLAVLYRRDPHHRTRMFASIAKMRGWNVGAFHDFEDAMNWLSEIETEVEGEEIELSRSSIKKGTRRLVLAQPTSKASSRRLVRKPATAAIKRSLAIQ